MDPKKCVMCQENPIKYTCPRCSRRTCSLPCCLNHKKTFQCNGQRDRSSFKPLDAMNDLDLLSDYRFLEEVQRCVDTSERDPLANQRKSFNETTRYQKMIQNKLKALGGIRILYLPKLSSRHQHNQMWFDRKTDDIHWHIECRFFVGSSSESPFLIWSITRLPTNETTLENLLDRFHQTHPNLFLERTEIRVFTENFGAQRKQLGKYQKSSFQTMVDLFRNRAIIEYPILYLCREIDENAMLEKLP